MKILLFGSNGMAGHVIYRYLKQKHEITTVARNGADYNLDICDLNELLKIDLLKFDVIINAIGLLVKESNENPKLAICTNSWFPKYLESSTSKSKTKIIHLSTDCVFSGKTGGYTELSQKDGEDIYSKTKAIGEIDNDKDLTIRTSIIGPEIKNSRSLFHWFMNQKDEINGFSEVFWNGLTTIELSKVIDFCIEKNIKGLLNVPSDPIDKKSLLEIINKIFKKGIKINDSKEIKHNKTISSIRNIDYKIPSHEEMINEMFEWISKNKDIYNY